jgi:hypothetical protein
MGQLAEALVSKRTSPYHTRVLLLPNIRRNSAIDLACGQSHGQCLGHVVRYRSRHRRIQICRSNPNICIPSMFKLACSQLDKIGPRNDGQDDIARKSFFEVLFNTQGVGRINYYAGMLRGDDGFDDTSQIVNIWQSFNAE